jgi:hypothetical protein
LNRASAIWELTAFGLNIGFMNKSANSDIACLTKTFRIQNGEVEDVEGDGIHGTVVVTPECKTELTWNQQVQDEWGFGLKFQF